MIKMIHYDISKKKDNPYNSLLVIVVVDLAK